MLKFALTGLAASLTFAPTAHAQLVVYGNSIAKDCYQKTKRGDPGRKTTIKLCEEALSTMPLAKKDRAATYVNTAILYLFSE